MDRTVETPESLVRREAAYDNSVRDMRMHSLRANRRGLTRGDVISGI